MKLANICNCVKSDDEPLSSNACTFVQRLIIEDLDAMSRPHDLVHPWYRVVRLKCHYVVRLTGARVLEDFFVISNDLASNVQDLVCGFDIF